MFSSVAQSCQLFATPWTAACQASLSFTTSQSLLKLMSIESVMQSNHLILCRPLLLLPSILIGLLKIVLIVAVCQTLSLKCGIQKIFWIKQWIDITKQKQTHRYREQTSSCRWGKVGRDKGRETRQGVQTIMYKINKL